MLSQVGPLSAALGPRSSGAQRWRTMDAASVPSISAGPRRSTMVHALREDAREYPYKRSRRGGSTGRRRGIES